MKYYQLILISVIATLGSSPAYAVYGETNLSYGGYPEPTCKKPYKPYEFTEQYQVDSYNEEVNRYIKCIKRYLEGADNDIKRIQDAAEEAIRKAKSPY